MRLRANWFRFRLRTLFVAVAVCSLILAWQPKIVRERRAMRFEITRRGAMMGSSTNDSSVLRSPLKAWRQLLGDESIATINLHPGSFTERDFEEVRKMFPEADLMQQHILDGRGLILPLEGQGSVKYREIK